MFGKQFFCLCFIVYMVLAVGCRTQGHKADRVLYAQSVFCGRDSKEVDWGQIDPLTFVQVLKQCDRNCVTIWNYPPDGWMQKQQIAELKRMEGSDEPCAAFVDSKSSQLPTGKTTVGRAVKSLIQQFGEGKSPVMVSAPQTFDTPEGRKKSGVFVLPPLTDIQKDQTKK